MTEETKPEETKFVKVNSPAVVLTVKDLLEEIIEEIMSGKVVSDSFYVFNKEHPNGLLLARRQFYEKRMIDLGGKTHPKFNMAIAKLDLMDAESQKETAERNDRFKKEREEYEKHQLEIMLQLKDFVPEDTNNMRIIAQSMGNKLPPIAEMGKNVVAAMLRTADQLVSTGTIKASPEEIERRRIICAGDGKDVPLCSRFIVEKERCAACGCFTKIKTWLTAERCPLGKW